MAEFLGDLAFMFEVFVLGFGVWLVVAGRKESSKLLAGTGWFVSLCAVGGLLCTTYYYMTYWHAGAFKTAYPSHHEMMMGSGGQMMGGMMKGRRGPDHMMMNPQMMANMKHSMMSKVTDCMHEVHGQTMNESTMGKVKECMKQKMMKGGMGDGHQGHR